MQSIREKKNATDSAVWEGVSEKMVPESFLKENSYLHSDI